MDVVALALDPEGYGKDNLKREGAKEAVKESLRRDNVFIPTYTVLLIALGLSVFCSRGSGPFLGIAIIILAILTSACDYLENHYLFLFAAGENKVAPLVSSWSLQKWILLSLGAAGAAPLFLFRTDWTRLVSIILVITGILGLGTAVNWRLVYLMYKLYALGLLVVGITFLIDLLSSSSWKRHWG